MKHEFLKASAPTLMSFAVFFVCLAMKATSILPAVGAATSAGFFVITMLELYKPSK
ncbi:hypothetical protein [Pseudomonas kitaguniensis]|uniref:hypothetical protein n=1 Tax=Pseudomonas kitaguniensis TaxID=2607908 RepID=UPI003BA0459F